jgi:PAS domain S-box-containing protein
VDKQTNIDLQILELQSEISELKKNNEQLQDLENRFKAIADNAPVLVWMSDTDKLCTYFNKGWLEFTGRTIDQEYGNGWAAGVHPDDFERCLETYVTSFDKRVPFKMQYRLKRNDGQFRWILDNGVPRYTLEGEFLGYIGSCVDINDQKTLNQELEDRNIKLARQNKELKAFNYIATHDLQEPLERLITYSTLVRNSFPEMLSPIISSYLDKIMEEAEKTRDLITKLLQYTLLTNDSSWRTKTNLTILLEEVLQTFKKEIIDKKIKIYADPLPEVEVVPWRIKKVFSNLIDNSIKFARPGIDTEIRVSANKIGSGAKIHSNLKDAEYWEISFTDNGIGFDNKYKDLVFDVFKKIENSSNSGQGIGLAIVKKILNNHDGEIFADSKPGEGTCFRMYIPL